MSERMFPVLMSYPERKNPICAKWSATGVPWDFLTPHEQQARDNHGQTLQRLAERGGLGIDEMLCIVEGKGLRYIERDIAEVDRRLGAAIRSWSAATKGGTP